MGNNSRGRGARVRGKGGEDVKGGGQGGEKVKGGMKGRDEANGAIEGGEEGMGKLKGVKEVNGAKVKNCDDEAKGGMVVKKKFVLWEMARKVVRG